MQGNMCEDKGPLPVEANMRLLMLAPCDESGSLGSRTMEWKSALRTCRPMAIWSSG